MFTKSMFFQFFFCIALLLTSDSVWSSEEVRSLGVADAYTEVYKWNQALINKSPEIFKEKMLLLTEDAFSFLRGTAHLMYADLKANSPLKLITSSPKGLIHGDAHIHNMAVLFTPGKQPAYGLEDFDETHVGPLGVDIFRMMVSIVVAFDQKIETVKMRKILYIFLSSYTHFLKNAKNSGWLTVRLPTKLQEFINNSLQLTEKDFLKKKIDEGTKKFKDKKIAPIPETDKRQLIKAFEYHLQQTVYESFPKSTIKILDIGDRIGKGLSSLGFKRMWALIEFKNLDKTSNKIIEIKEIKPNSNENNSIQEQARNILSGFSKGHRNYDIFLSVWPWKNKLFLVREIFPWAARLEYTDIPISDLEEIVKYYASVLANFHFTPQTNNKMVEWVEANRSNLCELALCYAKQTKEDWKKVVQKLETNKIQ